MLGKNNFSGKYRKAASQQYRFSIRKLTIGAVSVALSALMLNAVPNNNKVQAAPSTETKSVDTSQIGGGHNSLLMVKLRQKNQFRQMILINL
jgi:hypothetical protein